MMVVLPTRTRGALVLCLALGALAIGASAPAAQAAPIAPPPTAGIASISLQSTVCRIAKWPVRKAVTKLISLIAERRIAVLSASIMVPVGEQWCLKSNGLRKVLDRMVERRPELEDRVGPWVFNVRAVEEYWNSNYNRVTLLWRDYDFTGRRRVAYLWLRHRGGYWHEIGPDRFISHGAEVQFAVRVVNSGRLSSPWAYSTWYRIS